MSETPSKFTSNTIALTINKNFKRSSNKIAVGKKSNSENVPTFEQSATRAASRRYSKHSSKEKSVPLKQNKR